METLAPASWTARRDAHQRRVDAWLGPHLARRRRGEAHPVEDFLFTYYSHRPAALRRWHPGFGQLLDGPEAEEYLSLKGYGVSTGSTTETAGSTTETAGSTTGVSTGSTTETAGSTTGDSTGSATESAGSTTESAGSGVGVTAGYVASQRVLLTTLHRLLRATAARQAQLGCFGMHEWAMVYRLPQDDVRHAAWPLRLGSAGTDAVVEGHRIACSHFDAYRFFTDAARSRNTLNPGRDDRPAYEQPGCLHAGMDLYKHAYRLSPMVPSELVADCFALARDIRVLDMRASPYDLSGLGFSPVRVETTEGKQEYVAAQRSFAERGAPLRARLIEECERLLVVSGPRRR